MTADANRSWESSEASCSKSSPAASVAHGLANPLARELKSASSLAAMCTMSERGDLNSSGGKWSSEKAAVGNGGQRGAATSQRL